MKRGRSSGPETSAATFTDIYLGTKSASTDVYLGTKSTPTDVYLEPNQPPQRRLWMSTWELERERENEVRQPELEALTKRQLKCRRNKDSKLAKKFKNLEKENDNLKS